MLDVTIGKLVSAAATAIIAVAALAAAALPLLVGLLVVWLVSGPDSLRAGTSGWSLLHLLWMYPALFFVSSIAEGVVRHLLIQRAWVAETLQVLPQWIALSFMFLLFFDNLTNAVATAALSLLLFIPLVKWFEKHTPDEDEGDADPQRVSDG